MNSVDLVDVRIRLRKRIKKAKKNSGKKRERDKEVHKQAPEPFLLIVLEIVDLLCLVAEVNGHGESFWTS